MDAFYSDHFGLPLPPGHRFPMVKYRLLRDALAEGLPGVVLREAPSASDGELALAHEPGYVHAVANGALNAAQQREIGFPWSAEMVERSRRSVGATIAAARAALRDGVAGNLAGGTHHALADRGSGYCVFNDIAVAARLMQAEWHRARRALLRVAVIDLDVHQGNGTAAIFRNDPTVFTLSLHGAKNFPFHKEASDLDVELPDGCNDDAYLAALDRALGSLWDRHGQGLPGLVFYLAGADPHESDRLGRLKLSTDGLAERDRRVFSACSARGIPVALAMGGGYGEPIEATVAVQVGTYREALHIFEATRAERPARGVAYTRAMSHVASTRPAPRLRAEFRRFSLLDTRWMDNDVYGHVNNAVYYSYFDTAVNRYLIEAGALDVQDGEVIGLVVETQCRYFSPLVFPQQIEAGLRVAHIGRSSVRYEVGLFTPDEVTCAAHGHFIHVYVNRTTRTPVALPVPLMNALQGLL